MGRLEVARCPEPGAVGERPLLVDCAEAALRRHGVEHWRLRLREPWCYVEPPAGMSKVQGWKLHLSATPLSAPLVLARSADVLIRAGVAFKFAATVETVQELVSQRVDRALGGKFLTVYPEGTEDELLRLAEELHRATFGLPGPAILSDRPYRSGSLVHYRFGALRGVRALGNDGSFEPMLVSPDGQLVLDRRAAWYAPPPWAPADPFLPRGPARPASGGDEARIPTAARGPALLGGRYEVREVLQHAFTGSVFRATDHRTGAAVVIKQARAHAGSDTAGQDVRDVRRHEAEMLKTFAGSGLTPLYVELFERQGDLFLVEEDLSGVSLRRWVTDHLSHADGHPWGLPGPLAAKMARDLAGLVGAVHAKGLVLRDLNPNNVVVDVEGRPRLVDLELLVRPGEPSTRAHTPAYAAPEQIDVARIAPAPDQSADLYSLGATLFYLVTGADPVLPPDQGGTRTQRARIEPWLCRLATANPSVGMLADVVLRLLDPDPRERPAPTSVIAALADRTSAPSNDTARPPGSDDGCTRLLGDSLAHLLVGMHPENTDRLWASGPFGAGTDPLNVQHGAAGVLGVLTRAYAAGRNHEIGEAVRAAACWVRCRLGAEPRTLPGLYFGRSGTAWALLEASRVLDDAPLLATAAELALRVPVRWPNPDVCHGVAGAGLTQLRFWEVTGESVFLERAAAAAESIVAAVERREGLVQWPVPASAATRLGGLVHHGFAHGTAGVGAFLLAAARSTGERPYLELATAAARSLQTTADVADGAAYWPSGPESRMRRTSWCSGSSGVATFLVQAAAETDDPDLWQLVDQAAVAVRRSRWHAGTAQCHGLAGDAEFLLDAADALKDERYRQWAGELAECIWLRHALHDGRAVAPDETGTQVVADYGVGLSGVLAFLLRLRDGGPRIWLPDVLTRAGSTGDHTRSCAGPAAQEVAMTLRGGECHGARHQHPAAVAGGRP